MYTLGDIPRKGAQIYPDNLAVVFEDIRLTFKELNNRVNQLANAFWGLKFKKGDRVCIMADNCSEYVEIYYAAAKSGISITPINTRLAKDEIIHIINDSEANGCLVGDGYEEIITAIIPDLMNIEHWVSLHNDTKGFISYDSLITDASAEEPDVIIDEDDMVMLMYTGGTTGLPKGVMLSHRNFMTGILAAGLLSPISPEDSTCFVLPIFHVSSWPVFLLHLSGGKVVINRKPDLGEILRLIQDEKCTHMNLVPTIYGWLLQYPEIDQYDLSSLKMLSYAGSPFPPEVLKQCILKFGDIFMQGYGSTETCGGAVTALLAKDHKLKGPESKYLASAGFTSPCAELKVVDENNQRVPVGEVGEICVKGKHVMMGYWKNESLTKQVLKDGWYYMGDMGYIDDKGYLFLVDRKADMIVSGGENIYPKETEDVLYEHPAVMECAVVSSPDERWGESVHAVIVLKAGQKVTEEEMIKHCKARLAGYKCPKAVEFWESIPKTVIGKILRKDIKKRFWEGRNRTIG